MVVTITQFVLGFTRMSDRLTRQGVRDLGGNDRRPVKQKVHAVARSICGHWNAQELHDERHRCLDCGATSHFEYDYIADTHYEVWS